MTPSSENKKWVLVTGASSGMGRATAEELARLGYGVFALDRRTPDLSGEGIVPLTADVTDGESLERAFARVKEQCPGLFAICHFAGIYVLNAMSEMDEAEFTRAFDVNLFGVFRVNRTFLPLLSRGSRILITTSELAPLYPLPFTGLYAVTKSALDKYACSLRTELKLLGIDVSVLRPGAVNTGMLDVSTTALDRFCRETKLFSVHSKRFKAIVNAVEARNVPPEKIARRAAKLISRKHPPYVTAINRNPLLLLLNALPPRLQTSILQAVLK